MSPHAHEAHKEEAHGARREVASGSSRGHNTTRSPAGTVSPASRHYLPCGPNGARDPRPLVAIDWSGKGIHATFDGEEVSRHPSTEALLAQLTTPHVLVAESSFESWDLHRRRTLVHQIRSAGHEILVYRPIHTARNRPEGWAKTDENDAKVIFRIAVRGTPHLHPLTEPDESWVEFSRRVNHEYMKVRLSGHKTDLVDAAKQALGPYTDLSDEMKAALGNGRAYMPSVLAAAYYAALHATSRDTFERLLGLSGAGHPSLLRSEIHHHGFRHLRARGVTWPEFRRELRRAYQLFKASRTPPQPTSS